MSKQSNISTQIIEFNILDDFEFLSSDFPGLENLPSLIYLNGLCNLTSLNSPISSKNFLILMVWLYYLNFLSLIIPNTKMIAVNVKFFVKINLKIHSSAIRRSFDFYWWQTHQNLTKILSHNMTISLVSCL
jgi:hypothetical protein